MASELEGFLRRIAERAETGPRQDAARALLDELRGIERARDMAETRASLDAEKAWWDGYAQGMADGVREARSHG